MRIEVEQYTLTVSQWQLRRIAAIMRRYLQEPEKASHSAYHDGWETFLLNYSDVLNMHETISSYTGESRQHTDMVEEIMGAIDDARNK